MPFTWGSRIRIELIFLCGDSVDIANPIGPDFDMEKNECSRKDGD